MDGFITSLYSGSRQSLPGRQLAAHPAALSSHPLTTHAIYCRVNSGPVNSGLPKKQERAMVTRRCNKWQPLFVVSFVVNIRIQDSRRFRRMEYFIRRHAFHLRPTRAVPASAWANEACLPPNASKLRIFRPPRHPCLSPFEREGWGEGVLSCFLNLLALSLPPTKIHRTLCQHLTKTSAPDRPV